MRYILYPFAWILRGLYMLVDNYGIALILFSLVIKFVLLPLTIKSKKSLMKTSRLTPKLKALEAKYAGDQLKYQQEVTKLYKEEKISPMGGCLWSLLPMILMIALYYIIRQPLTYLMGMSATEVAGLTELMQSYGYELSGAYPQLTIASHIGEYFEQVRAIAPGAYVMNFNLFGLDLSQIPDWKFLFAGKGITWAQFGLFLIPVLSGLANFGMSMFSQKLNNSVATDEKGQKTDPAASINSSMKTMLYLMPLMSVYIGFIMPAGISVYWIAQAVFSAVQEAILTKRYRKIYDEEDAIKAARAAEEEALEAERERRREELKSGAPTAQNANTSKRKLKNQQKAMALPTVEGKLSEEEREALKQQQAELVAKRTRAMAGEIPVERPYSRGRAYDPDRYSRHSAPTAEPSEESKDE